MEYQAFLTTGTPERRYGEPQTDYYAHTVDYFEAAMVARNLPPPVRVDAHEAMPPSFAAALQYLTERIAVQLDRHKLNIVGLTNRFGRSFGCAQLARALRARAAARGAPLMVIGGGPHFVREALHRNGSPMADSVANALLKRCDPETPVYDAVVSGGFRAFVELLTAVQADEIEYRNNTWKPTTPLPRGYYYYDAALGQVVGEGVSGVPTLDAVPVTMLEIPERGGHSLVAVFSNVCVHGCDFCSIPKYIHFDKERVIGGVQRAVARYGADAVSSALHFTLWDPTPLAKRNRDRTMDCLTSVWSTLGRHIPPEMCLCGPHELLTRPTELMQDIEALKPVKITIGRDAIGEPGASFMGCKQDRKLKPAASLRDERAGLEYIIRRVGEMGRPVTVELSYIISPVETVESLNALFDEMRDLIDLSTGQLSVTVDWSFLYPCPGTPLLHDRIDLVSDMVYDTLDQLGAWDEQLVVTQFPDSCLGAMRGIFGPHVSGGVYERRSHEAIRRLRG